MGESFTEAVIREVKKETGLRIASPQICGMKDWEV
ncbi:NUDIX domain-containing protein [Streptococcus sp. MSK15_114]